MPQIAIVSHGEAAAVVLPVSVLEATGLRVGDSVDATVEDGQLILRPVDDEARRRLFQRVADDVFERRRDAFERLA